MEIKATPKMISLAKEALEIQDACNLCGLAQLFAKVMIDLGDCGGTDNRNRHPITVVWLDKMNSLAQIQDLGNDRVSGAFDVVTCLAAGTDVAKWHPGTTRTCNCGSGELAEERLDGHGIYLFTCCDKCLKRRLEGFRQDIMEAYDCDEVLDPEDYSLVGHFDDDQND